MDGRVLHPSAIAIWKSTLVMGAWGEYSAFVYNKKDSDSEVEWELQTNLRPIYHSAVVVDPGYALALKGDLLLMSSRLANNGVKHAGLVHVFRNKGGSDNNWIQTQTIESSSILFGQSVEIIDPNHIAIRDELGVVLVYHANNLRDDTGIDPTFSLWETIDKDDGLVDLLSFGNRFGVNPEHLVLWASKRDHSQEVLLYENINGFYRRISKRIPVKPDHYVNGVAMGKDHVFVDKVVNTEGGGGMLGNIDVYSKDLELVQTIEPTVLTGNGGFGRSLIVEGNILVIESGNLDTHVSVWELNHESNLWEERVELIQQNAHEIFDGKIALYGSTIVIGLGAPHRDSSASPRSMCVFELPKEVVDVDVDDHSKKSLHRGKRLELVGVSLLVFSLSCIGVFRFMRQRQKRKEQEYGILSAGSLELSVVEDNPQNGRTMD